jgi:hypothetical protein
MQESYKNRMHYTVMQNLTPTKGVVLVPDKAALEVSQLIAILVSWGKLTKMAKGII